MFLLTKCHRAASKSEQRPLLEESSMTLAALALARLATAFDARPSGAA